LAITGKYGSWTVDTDAEKDSLEEGAQDGHNCFVKGLPVKQYRHDGERWNLVGGSPQIIVSETEPPVEERYDGLIWIEKT
jgi:hypothetical protein